MPWKLHRKFANDSFVQRSRWSLEANCTVQASEWIPISRSIVTVTIKRKDGRHFPSSDTDESAMIDVSVDKRPFSSKDDNNRICQ